MSVAWVSAGVGAIGIISGRSAAKKADATNRAAVAAQSGAADDQLALAQEQWDYQKNVLNPKNEARADEANALFKKIANQGLDDAAHTRQLSDEAITQAKKSWKYQDMYSAAADRYASGELGEAEAGMAAADVEQGFDGAAQAMQRNAGRYGINPGSEAYIDAAGDMYTQKALARAGAQTRSRLASRDKAEAMVATAAGAGKDGFGTGMSAAGATTAALGGATGAGAAGANNTVANQYAYTNAMGGVSKTFGDGVNSWNSSARNAQNSPLADYNSGLVSAGLKMWGANGGKLPSWGSTPAFSYDYSDNRGPGEG